MAAGLTLDHVPRLLRADVLCREDRRHVNAPLDGVPISEPVVASWLREYMSEGILSLGASSEQRDEHTGPPPGNARCRNVKTLEDLRQIREQARKAIKLREGQQKCKVVVAMGTCGIASGAREVMSAILDELDKRGVEDVAVTQSGCKGLCDKEPTVDVIKAEEPTITYGYVTPEKARTIVAQHIVNDRIAGEWVIATE